jgi:peptide/nickel transport system substrate-binding protein
LNDNMPVAWISHSRGLQGVSARLHNVVMDLRGEMATLSRWERDGSASRTVAKQ